jgi:hypothetical protein
MGRRFASLTTPRSDFEAALICEPRRLRDEEVLQRDEIP